MLLISSNLWSVLRPEEPGSRHICFTGSFCHQRTIARLSHAAAKLRLFQHRHQPDLHPGESLCPFPSPARLALPWAVPSAPRSSGEPPGSTSDPWRCAGRATFQPGLAPRSSASGLKQPNLTPALIRGRAWSDRDLQFSWRSCMSRKWIENPTCSWSYCLQISSTRMGSFPNARREEQTDQHIFLKHRTLAHSERSPVATEVRGDSCRGQVALVGSLNPQVFSGFGTLAISVFTREGMPLAC